MTKDRGNRRCTADSLAAARSDLAAPAAYAELDRPGRLGRNG
jgi:hypothetical protein